MPNIAIIEPLVLPDERRPAAMPPLPDWVKSRLASISGAWLNGKWVAQLPQALILEDQDRAAVLHHASCLSKHLDKTPATSADAEAATLTTIAKMMLALPGQRATEDSAEAKGEAYLAALDDVTPWAVADAVRGWYRAEHGPKFNYAWAPAPGDLRTLALGIEAKVRARVKSLENLAYAMPLIEFSDAHREEMLLKLGKLSEEIRPRSMRTPTQQAAE